MAEQTEKTIPIKNKYEKAWWRLTILSVDHARQIIAEVSWTFIVIGIILVIFALWLPDNFNILDGALFLFLGAMLGARKSLWVSVLMVIVTAIGVYTTGYSKFTGAPGGTNIILAIIIFYAAVKALLAVQYLKKLKGTDDAVTNSPSRSERWGNKVFPWLSWVSLAILAVVVFLIIVGVNSQQG